MEIRELRIGSIVTIDNPQSWPHLKDIPMRVTGIEEKHFEHAPNPTYSISLIDAEGKQYFQLNQFIAPVILSESLLIDSGFENWGYDLLFWKIDIDGGIFEICGADRLGGFFVWNWHEDSTKDTHHQIEVNSLHQLQNIIFDLSGKELPIKK